MKKLLLTTTYLLLTTCLLSQLNTPKYSFTQADTLRGTNNENRSWWDVLRYDITVKPDFEKKEIEGKVLVTYVLNQETSKQTRTNKQLLMQVDLQKELVVDSIIAYYETPEISHHTSNKGCILTGGNTIKTKFDFIKNDNVILIQIGKNWEKSEYMFSPLTIYYHGKPHQAKNAPWDGGWVWAKDSLQRPFVSVACQGLGASCWFPCKDYQGDEPDSGASLTIIVPDSLVAVGNGLLKSKAKTQNPKDITYTWNVVNPINTYCIVPYIGNYVNFTDTFNGEKGTLDLSYWVLDYNKEKAEEQFKQVKPMLRALEYWFGAYPFYKDSYKLVEAPYLGMEHQSDIAYGNGYKNGYKGRDLSGSGWGLKWDFIIVHESGHEWFANNITTKDIADMWVHEGFTNYSEVLFTDYYYGKQAGNEYCYGLRKNIRNDEPIIGPYGVNKEGSGDMYYKASNMIHSIRNALNNDEKFRQLLRKMNEQFYHQTVTTQQIEQFLIDETNLNLQSTFNQYLRTTQMPTLEYYYKGKKIFYRYTNCIEGFNMPITIPLTNKTIIPTTQWQHKRMKKNEKEWLTKKNIEFLYLLKADEIKQQ